MTGKRSGAESMGGREGILPYARPWIDGQDIKAVTETLLSDWLTTGPKVAEFERMVADYVGVAHAVAVSSGTAGLHCAMAALGIGPGDEVIVPAITFAATANCVVYAGARPVFADVRDDDLLVDPADVERKITARTRAVIGVDYAGQPCRWDDLRAISNRHGLALVADACHALGAEYKGRKVGTLADLTVFSFHPVKQITTGEGGMIVTCDSLLAERMKAFRNHGITCDSRQRASRGTWFYDVASLGYNYRITDLQCALGISQLGKLPGWLARRRRLAGRYDEALADLAWLNPLAVRDEVLHAYHLYVVKVASEKGGLDRDSLFLLLREKGIQANVHYTPVHLFSFYRRLFGTGPGLCPTAEAAYGRIITLPLFAAMQEEDLERVVAVLREAGR